MPREGSRVLCDKCRKPVHDLAQLTEVQARWLLVQHAGESLCLKYRHDRQGRIEFRAPPPPARSVLAVAALALSACAAYAEPGELDSPAEGAMCEDASGYTIPCADASEPVIPDENAPLEPTPARPTATTERDDDTIAADEVPVPGVEDWRETVDPTDFQPCPLPDGQSSRDFTQVVVGVVAIDPEPSGAVKRRTRREVRRERRRARREARGG